MEKKSSQSKKSIKDYRDYQSAQLEIIERQRSFLDHFEASLQAKTLDKDAIATQNELLDSIKDSVKKSKSYISQISKLASDDTARLPLPESHILSYPFEVFDANCKKTDVDYWTTLPSVQCRWNEDLLPDKKMRLVNPTALTSPRCYIMEFCADSVIFSNEADKYPEGYILDPDREYNLYEEYFSKKKHTTYISYDQSNPVLVSVEDLEGKLTPRKALVRTKAGIFRVLVQSGNLEKELCRVVPRIEGVKLSKIKTTEPLIKELVQFDRTTRVTKYKFGLIYIGPKQKLESDFYKNQTCACGDRPGTSKAFEDFLTAIGRVRLRGYEGYRGGLDVRDDATGMYSCARKYKDYEIMFHVSVDSFCYCYH